MQILPFEICSWEGGGAAGGGGGCSVAVEICSGRGGGAVVKMK